MNLKEQYKTIDEMKSFGEGGKRKLRSHAHLTSCANYYSSIYAMKFSCTLYLVLMAVGAYNHDWCIKNILPVTFVTVICLGVFISFFLVYRKAKIDREYYEEYCKKK